MSERKSHAGQVLASLIVAAIIGMLAVVAVTGRLPLDEYPHEDRKEDRREDNSGRG